MTRQEQREQAAIEYCSGNKGADARVRGAFLIGAEWADRNPQNHWHDAQGDDLPEIDREVIVLLDNGKVCFAHRPVESYITISIINHSEREEYYPKRYDKGGWNIPNVKWWLDIDIKE